MEGFYTPQEILGVIIEAGKKKAVLPAFKMLLLGILAGAYIAFGAELSTIISCDLSKNLGIGFCAFLSGSVFSVGLMLVVLGGAELFTGNNLMASAVLAKEAKWAGLLKNWVIVYFANFVGALILAGIIYASGLWKNGDLAVGMRALTIANAKVNLSFPEAFWRAVGCNWLVCLAVWLAVGAKDFTGKILGIYFPIMAFVASGFEHSVANMYFVPIGIFLKSHALFSQMSSGLANLNWMNFITKNLIPVTLGNIVGGAIFVGAVYWLVYKKEK